MLKLIARRNDDRETTPVVILYGCFLLWTVARLLTVMLTLPLVNAIGARKQRRSFSGQTAVFFLSTCVLRSSHTTWNH